MEKVDERVCAFMDWMGDWVDEEVVGGWFESWEGGWADGEWVGGRAGKWINGWVGRVNKTVWISRLDGWVSRWMSGWVDSRWVGRWLEEMGVMKMSLMFLYGMEVIWWVGKWCRWVY